MKKYKQLFVGIIIGAILFNLIPSFATTVKQYIAYESPYPMYVNGKEVKLDKPILNYDGSTYIPLRATADILGVPVDFDGKIIKVGKENNNTTTSTNSQNIPTLKLGETYTLNNIEITVNQILYNQTDPHIVNKLFVIKGKIKNKSDKIQKIMGVAFLKTNTKDLKQELMIEDRPYLIQYSDNNYYFDPQEEKEFTIIGTQTTDNNFIITNVLIEILNQKINFVI
ncbi:stalk domain-containing protein [Caldanaerobacter subterraneus]|uniref:Copper amine oxidase-like N-terminal domain-containing protein n=1 Tax=Caldanaerobacter subterraneus TaxID=911092 RepID=A0A7Y2PLI7_9THEO|nr:stalk domain-containing protein [Caldanaerobacter subterraneus]NNG66143.1 hypothetical protein [Caldanaerobacter subterraneus]